MGCSAWNDDDDDDGFDFFRKSVECLFHVTEVCAKAYGEIRS
jgi:hypothetical protein